MKRKVLIDRSEEIAKGLQRTKVTLEDLIVQNESKEVLAIIGKIRVANLSFGKFVFARVTFNSWASFRDYGATHTDSSEDGLDDTFAFGFTRRDKRPIYVEFALSCVQNGQEFWDNNGGKNYCFHLREDPFSDSESAQITEPEIVTTWQVADENSPHQEEIIFDTSSYPHFQAHPLTPTKIHLYTSLKEVPEKEIVPSKVQDTKHVHAFNALALESLLIVEERPSVNDEIEAVAVNAEESGIELAETEPSEIAGDEEQVTSPIDGDLVQEDAVEPLMITKQVNDETHDEIFDRLTQEQGVITVDLQIIEESSTGDLNDGERNEDQLPLKQNGVIDEQEQNATTANADTKKEEALTHQQEDIKDDKKKTKENKKKATKEKEGHEASSEGEIANRQFGSSQKVRIEDESTPKRHKKSFLSRMACCGKAEPD